jgi:hypothetical protein
MGVYGTCKEFLETGKVPERYKDTYLLHFDNETVVITDPCYVEKEGDNYWNFEESGPYDFIMRSTLYGDWSCTTVDTDTGEKLGDFCADAGMVAVFEMEDLKKYNPEMEDWCKEHSWCATVIPNFTGDVQIKVGISEGKYYDFYCYVEGRGNINFRGFQTGF